MGDAETERFARLMRELKERGGASYGTLARRLYTSGSSLHRYCNGEAVPAEFAVVDRFARACGASRDEAVELHRAWLLADARRRAPTPPGPPEAPAPAPGPGPAQVPGPEAGGGGSGHGGAAGGSVVRPAGAGGAAGVRHRRRGVVAAGVGVVAAVTVAAVLAVGPSQPPAGGAAPSRAGGRAGPVAPGATEPALPTPSASPSGSVRPSLPAAAAPGSPVPQASQASQAPQAAPAAVVRSHVWASGCDHAYLSERAPAAVPAPPVQADAPGWARAQRAVHAGSQIVEVTLHGTGEGAVVLQGLEVRVAARRTPPPWNVYRMSLGCGGALTPAVFAVDLDAPRPLARPLAGNDSGEPIPAPRFPVRVSADEPAVLRVEATAARCDCDWYLDLRWSGPGGSFGTLRLDDSGVPWRTSGTTGRPEYGYATEQGRWMR
ncbi:helix-turn-helix domain-containing protein [Streptomyces sp. NPDC048507]|uniref:helix-turn-helix domain-containing protein n=1 Tax=Streptomyces sp. NPDC048507 TaxID=3365560 RepID=UPI003714847E